LQIISGLHDRSFTISMLPVQKAVCALGHTLPDLFCGALNLCAVRSISDLR